MASSSSHNDATATYRAYCQELGIKANSRVLSELPTTPAAVAAFTSWDLSGNAVGTKGAVAVARLVQSSLPNLQRLNLAGNNLASAATQELYNALVGHPSLTELDVSQNDIRLGGPALVDFVKRNKKIVALNIEGTFLRPLFQRLIALHLKRNAEGPQESGAATPAPAAAAAPAASKSATVSAPPPRAAAAAAAAPSHHADGSSKTPPVSGKRRMKFAGAAAGSDDDQHRETDRVSSPFMGGNDEAHGAQEEEAAFGAFKEPFATTHDPNVAHAHDDGHEQQQADADEAAAMMAQMKARGAKKQRRPTVSSEVYKEEEIDQFQPQKYDHAPEARQFLFETLENHELFSHLEDHELYVAVDAMFPVTRAKGDTLYEAGDDELDTFFIVASGTVSVTSGSGAVTQVTRGATLQDTMLLYAGKCSETAQATTDVALFSLDRRTYRCVLSQASKKKRAMYEGFLSSVSFLKHLSKQELLALADALKPAHYEAGQRLITYGSTGENFFLIVEGTVDVWGRDDKGKRKWVCDFKAGDCVGELEFLHHHLCVADVVAKSPLVRTARMNRRHFEMVMGPVKDVLARTAQESEVFSYYRDQLSKIKEQGDQSPLRQTSSPTPGAAAKH